MTVSGAVQLAGGTLTVADGTSMEPPSGGSGSLQVAGGTLSLAGSLSTTVLAITGGTLAVTRTIAAGSQVTWSGGTLAGAVRRRDVSDLRKRGVSRRHVNQHGHDRRHRLR